ncbi:MAG: helix-turn-helix domain-containing protein [Burkholderiaceae bacterium]|nr:helix-turn-helix domain-containing protein [Burkholderiaceae bacterium]
MTEVDPTASATPSAPSSLPPGESAGAMLRRAREAQGLDLDQLALLLKVPVRKLEALEADRHDALPGTAFVRGLAMSVARQLGIDAHPVLAALPSMAPAPQALESVSRGLATPYREPGSRVIGGGAPDWLRPSVIAPLLLLLLALLFWFAPPLRGLFGSVGDSVAEGADVAASQAAEFSASAVDLAVQAASAVPAAAASAVQVLGGAASAPPLPSAVVDTVHSAPPEEPSASMPSAAASGSVVLRTTAESWVEVRDAGGAVLLSRMLLPGEAVGLDGTLPMKLKIGNADGTRVSLRGQPVDLLPHTRDNIARLELK